MISTFIRFKRSGRQFRPFLHCINHRRCKQFNDRISCLHLPVNTLPTLDMSGAVESIWICQRRLKGLTSGLFGWLPFLQMCMFYASMLCVRLNADESGEFTRKFGVLRAALHSAACSWTLTVVLYPSNWCDVHFALTVTKPPIIYCKWSWRGSTDLD